MKTLYITLALLAVVAAALLFLGASYDDQSGSSSTADTESVSADDSVTAPDFQEGGRGDRIPPGNMTDMKPPGNMTDMRPEGSMVDRPTMGDRTPPQDGDFPDNMTPPEGMPMGPGNATLFPGEPLN